MNNYKIKLFVLFFSNLIQTIFAAACRKNEECSKEQYCDITGLGRCADCSTICNVNTNAMQKECERVCPGYIQAQANRAGTTTAPWVIPSVATANRAGTTTAPWVIPSVATDVANGVGTTMAPEVMAGVITGALIAVAALFIAVGVLIYCLKKGKRPCKRYRRDRAKRKNRQDPEENVEMLNASDTAKRKDSQDPEENTKMLSESESTSKLSPAETPPSTGQSRTRNYEREDSKDRLSINPMQPPSLHSDQEIQPSTGEDPDDMVLKHSADPESSQVATINEKNQTATPWTLEDSERYCKREDNDAVTSPTTTTDSGFPQSDPNSQTTTPDHTHRSSSREESPEGSSDPGIKVMNSSNVPQPPSQLASSAILKTASPCANQTNYQHVNGLTEPKANSVYITATGPCEFHINAHGLTNINNPLNNVAPEKITLNNIIPSTQDQCELVTSKNGGQGISSPTQESFQKEHLANGHTCLKDDSYY
ncbi:uncharacterized protein LOC106176655 isoform X2 [Lingula anatina]|uniref:Uncharacterized protein LOC106176655 isoform X2 n=1 Tax=Lingula anatina TaxID=7574 RepID=A0A2R2MSJ6_LINAN|nr:uncharacterized protein LOC106176655 isoform X2 [Lingula anatina]|eukprot:XP_023932972.1 uncharacterized protein LOC106176655 isoform X2 [Lingula anatina]